MPNHRRQRFSPRRNVDSETESQSSPSPAKRSPRQRPLSSSEQNALEFRLLSKNVLAMKAVRRKNKEHAPSSTNHDVNAVDSNTITRLLKRRFVSTIEKDVMVTSGEIDRTVEESSVTSTSNNPLNTSFVEKVVFGNETFDQGSQHAEISVDPPINRLTFDDQSEGQSTASGISGFSVKRLYNHHENTRLGRSHRAKVRTPKVRLSLNPHENPRGKNYRNSLILETLETAETFPTDYSSDVVMNMQVVNYSSTESVEAMCRICHGGDALSCELGMLVSACSCRGTVGRLHVKCLERWLTESGKSRCELCGCKYDTLRVHRYGVLRALIMWAISQNTKQLLVDGLGIALMSPLAVFAAWLSSRTLAGLMANDTLVTPWPLASTFVLACMTLVCYYCWIVSAATRHAIGWWSWYRSQYEVRLQHFTDTDQSTAECMSPQD